MDEMTISEVPTSALPANNHPQKRRGKKQLVIVLTLLLVATLSVFIFHSSSLSTAKKITPSITVSPTKEPEKLVLQRETGNGGVATVAEFNWSNVQKSDIQRWHDQLIFTQERPSLDASIPTEIDLYDHDLTTGNTNRIYSTDQFDFSNGGKLSPGEVKTNSAYREINFLIYKDRLYFSVKSEGYDGYNPGPGKSFYVDLPDFSVIKPLYDKGGSFTTMYGHSWLNTYYSAQAESYPTEIYRLFNPDTKEVIPVAELGPIVEGSPRNRYLGTLPSGEWLFEEAQDTVSVGVYIHHIPSIHIFSLSLGKDTDVITMPSDASNALYLAKSQKLFIVGSKSIYLYSLTGKSLKKIADLNSWNGDTVMKSEVPLFQITKKEQDEIAMPDAIGTIDDNICFEYGSAIAGPLPLNALYSLKTNTLKKVKELPKGCFTYPDLKLIDFTTRRDFDHKFPELKLPSSYHFVTR